MFLFCGAKAKTARWAREKFCQEFICEQIKKIKKSQSDTAPVGFEFPTGLLVRNLKKKYIVLEIKDTFIFLLFPPQHVLKFHQQLYLMVGLHQLVLFLFL